MRNPNTSDKRWHILDEIFAEVFSRPMPETDSEALRFILMEVQSLTRVGMKDPGRASGDSKRPQRELGERGGGGLV